MTTEFELSQLIENATRNAFLELFDKHLGSYYYCSLITSGEAHAPVLTAWSLEALEHEAKKLVELGIENTLEDAKYALKWSYSETPYFMFGDSHFECVRHAFNQRPQISAKMEKWEWDDEYQLRLRAMEVAMKNLDNSHLFGDGDVRLNMIINVEVMPPDKTNSIRAMRLNPFEALKEWIEECAEPI